MAVPIKHERLSVCRTCIEWQDRKCVKGHVLESPARCPLGRFEALAVSSPSPPVIVAPVVSVGACRGCGGNAPAPATWAQVMGDFVTSIARWLATGMKLVGTEEHNKRVAECMGCPFYQHFRCQKCGCFTYVKSKLATEKCPIGKW